MRAQTAGRRLRSDPLDDATVLELLELASHATADHRRRCAFIVVRDPDVRHQLARTYRQGWSVYKRVLRTRSYERRRARGAPVGVGPLRRRPRVTWSACVDGRRPRFPAVRRRRVLRGRAAGGPEPAARGAAPAGLGASATMLPLWSTWEARRTLGLPRRITPVAVVALGWPRGGRCARADAARSATWSTSTATATSRFALSAALSRPDTA